MFICTALPEILLQEKKGEHSLIATDIIDYLPSAFIKMRGNIKTKGSRIQCVKGSRTDMKKLIHPAIFGRDIKAFSPAKILGQR